MREAACNSATHKATHDGACPQGLVRRTLEMQSLLSSGQENRCRC